MSDFLEQDSNFIRVCTDCLSCPSMNRTSFKEFFERISTSSKTSTPSNRSISAESTTGEEKSLRFMPNTKKDLGQCSSSKQSNQRDKLEIANVRKHNSMTIKDGQCGDTIDNVKQVSTVQQSDKWCLARINGTGPGGDNLDADIVSATQFNKDGSLCAVGDKGGRITLYKRNNDPKLNMTFYQSYISFVSHSPEFDYLKSLEIEEKINKVRFLDCMMPAKYLLSTNDKTIKLWKIVEKKFSVDPASITGGNGLCVPRMQSLETPIIEARSKAVYKNGHTYHVNSVSPSSDGETFISSDDLRINLWHLDVQNQLYNIVDIKPVNMEDITEVITCAEFHPTACNLFAYTSSKGCIRLCDLRTSALCDQCYTLFEVKDDPSARSFFSEIISSISDIRFSNCGKYMLTRDYMNLKVWDCRKQSSPAEQYPVHPHIKERMCSMYENDYIFDKFDCSWSGDDSMLLTGSYGDIFVVVDRASQQVKTYHEPRHDIPVGFPVIEPLQVTDCASNVLCTSSSSDYGLDGGFFDDLDYSKRILHCAWDPDYKTLLTATDCYVHFYSKRIDLSDKEFYEMDLDDSRSTDESRSNDR